MSSVFWWRNRFREGRVDEWMNGGMRTWINQAMMELGLWTCCRIQASQGWMVYDLWFSHSSSQTLLKNYGPQYRQDNIIELLEDIFALPLTLMWMLPVFPMLAFEYISRVAYECFRILKPYWWGTQTPRCECPFQVGTIKAKFQDYAHPTP